jgi:anti-sigma28 factor (negative regulator of flagellin synthesis)
MNRSTEVSDMNNDDSVDDVASETTSNAPATDASGNPEDETVTPSSPRTQAQEAEAEELSRKIAEIERKVADGN